MNKILLFLFLLILVIGISAGILVLVEPVDVKVTRCIIINSARDSVAKQVMQFKNWPNWSPWNMKDTSVRLNFSGTDGQAGSGYHWVDDELRAGEGELKNNAVSDSTLEYDLHLIKPADVQASGLIQIDKVSKGVLKVTWVLNKHTPRPLNALHLFVNIDKMMGGDFESGLSNLKKYVEARNPPPPLFEIKEMDYPEHLFEGYRETVPMADIEKFFQNKRNKLDKELKDRINGPLNGLFYTWDTTEKETDMATVYPVADTVLANKELDFFHAGPSKAVMATQKGGYSKSVLIHSALAKYLADKKLKQDLVIEEYIAGPPKEPDSNKWITNIYYLYK